MPAADRLAWFHFSPGDLIGDPAVQAMSDEQLGKYLRVLCAMYQRNCGVASEDEVRAWSRCPQAEWAEHRAALLRAFTVRRDGVWVQKRVEIEVRAAKNRVEKASKSGRAGAVKRWGSVAVLKRSDG